MTISSSFSNSSHTAGIVAAVVITAVAVAVAVELSIVAAPVIPIGIKSKVKEGNEEICSALIKRVCEWYIKKTTLE
jgi:hypothetical protein